jgi:peptidyl-prolyl cis-trans isomerase SurA
MKLAAAVLAAGLAVSACSTTKMGAAALTGGGRITTGTLTAQVANLNSAYAQDQAKGVKPQNPTSQEAQQILHWLILFQIYDKMAAQHNVTVTPADQQSARTSATKAAASSNLSLDEYWSAGGALPPDLLPQVYQASAIENALVDQIDGGKSPTSAAAQAAVESKLSHYQCVAAKDLDINVNPQYGEYDYSNFSVVPAPSTLAADPTPSPTTSPPLLTPPC